MYTTPRFDFAKLQTFPDMAKKILRITILIDYNIGNC